MTQYKVINQFQEKNHDNYVYEVGDSYPAKGKKFVKSRAEFLSKVNAEYGLVFLKAFEVEKVSQSKNEGDAE